MRRRPETPRSKGWWLPPHPTRFAGHLLPQGEKETARDLCRQISLLITSAVSLIRVAKPHSLSYQVRTRASLPSTTWVCGRAAVRGRGDVVQVGGDQRLVGHRQHALHRAVGGGLDARR